MDANREEFESCKKISKHAEEVSTSDDSEYIDIGETISDETDTAGEDLLNFFNSLLQEKSKSYYIDDEFESKGLKKNKDVEKSIKEVNAAYQMRDAELKLESRRGITNLLLIILLIQMVFVNLIIAWLIVSQTANLSFFSILGNEQLSDLTSLTKWYAAVTVAELISIFIYIIKILYKKPKIT